jgi:hypothetical protein
MLKQMVLALSTVLIVLTMAFPAVALAHDPGADDPGAHDHSTHSQGQSQEQPTYGKQQASDSGGSHSGEGPPQWLPLAFTLSSVAILCGFVVVLRRS